MKKFLLLFLLVLNYGYAQLYNNPDGTPGQYLNLTPNSPQATELVRHGNVPVNLSTGQLNYSVPLYTIAAGGFSWPINLSYGYSGLKAEERPSAAGLGWSLISGGVISREVRGLPDEHAKGYYSYASQTTVNDYVAGNGLAWDRAVNTMKGIIDTEPDKYNVNAGGLSFAFKVVKTDVGLYEAKLLSPENYKVDFTWNKITVTDDNGIRYVFDQKEVHRPHGLPVDIYIPDWSDSWTVSWFLSEIILKDYDDVDTENASFNKIKFEYQTHEYQSKNFYATASLNDRKIYYSYLNSDCQLINGEIEKERYSRGGNFTDIRQPSLKKIIFPQGTVDFTLNNTNEYPLYTQLKITNSDSEQLYKYDFTHTGVRRTLDKITKNDAFYYAFDYYNKDKVIDFSDNLPQKITAQDNWGYYNGQDDNQYVIHIPTTRYKADKNSYFDYTVAGALKTIIYPSKGETEIEYEQNQIKVGFEEVSTIVPNMQHKYRLQSGNRQAYDADLKTTTQLITLNNSAYASISSKEQSFNGSGDKTEVYLKRLSGPDCTPGGVCAGENTALITGNFAEQAELARNFCQDPYPLICPNYFSGLNDGGDAGGYNPDTGVFEFYSRELSTNGIIKVPAGTYELLVTTKGYAEAEIEFAYTEIDPSGFINGTSGGIRVVKTTDSDGGNNATPNDITIYDYNNTAGFSKGVKFHEELKSVQKNGRFYYFPDECSSVSCVYIPFHTKLFYYATLNPISVNSGLPIFYPEVKVYKNPRVVYNPLEDVFGCNNLDATVYNEDGSSRYELAYKSDLQLGKKIIPINGYSIKKFKTPAILDASGTYPFTPGGADKTGNELLEDETYGLSEFMNNNYMAAKTINEYETIRLSGEERLQLPAGIKIEEKFYRHPLSKCSYSVPDESEMDEYYYRKIYREYDRSLFPNKLTSTSYSMKGEELQTVVSETFYNDKNYVDYTIATDSKGSVIKTELIYPFSDGAPTSASLLVDKNKIASPVQTTGYKDNVVIGSQKFSYGNARSNYPYVEKVFIAKEDKNLNNDLSDDFREVVEYYSYDKAGNPTEIEQKDGTRVVYLWGYNYSSPVAKIENATLTEVLAIMAGSSSEGIAMSLDYEVLQIANHNTLTILCNTLRENLPNSMVSSFTYKPLVGMISQTDPRGRVSTYEYDDQNRLLLVKDHDGNVLEQNEYHFRAE